MCAAAQRFPLMLAGRSVQGLGAGGILALTDVLITDMVPLRYRGKYIALIGIVWAVGSVSGPILGGVFAERSTWRWIFFINLPIAGISFIGILVFLNLQRPEGSLSKKIRQLDYFGSFLFTASLTSFLIPVTWGGVMYQWSSWHTLLPLLVGVTGLIAFVVYETRFATKKLIPFHLFNNYSTSTTYLEIFLHGVVLWCIIYYMPLYFEGAQGFSPVPAGLTSLPQSCTVVPCAAAVGLIATKTGRYRWALWAGWLITTLGCGLLCLFDVDTPRWEWVIINLISGIGIGLLFSALSLALQASVPQEHVAYAVGLLTFFRAFGQSIGVAVGGVIFQNRIKAELRRFPGLESQAIQYSNDAAALVQIIHRLPPDMPERQLLEKSYANAIRAVWIFLCALSAVAFFISFTIKGYTLDQALQTSQGFKRPEPSRPSVLEAPPVSESEKSTLRPQDGKGQPESIQRPVESAPE